ncbi:MAG: methyltransferase [Alphaproteobacteria bacterium]|nr:methyltransferase [Alphaproteobacteria bacterium]
MMPRRLKAVYYVLMRVPMRLNGVVYRHFRQPRAPLKAHLGPGKTKYIPGWLNVDANILTARIDLWANILDPLPFRNDSLACVYSYHVIEHLPDARLPTHFRDLFRVVQPGGGIRVGGPHGGNAMAKYMEGDPEWFPDFPDKRASLGGRLANFILCRGEHLSVLTESYLRELAEAAGFAEIRFCLPGRESDLVGEEVLATEDEDDFACPHSIVMEARKPLS